ncbi:MAG: YCF48-related protein [Xanthomonadales bacterium]|nr:YCF48-related protein [Xanthomonadales bacterium]
MKQRIVYSLEILLSVLVVGGLLWVAFYAKPKTEVAGVEAALFGYRNNFFGVTVPDSDGRTVWAVGTGGRIIRSEDGGVAWTIQDTPTKNNLQDIAAWDENRAVVAGDRGMVLVTGDGGETWIEVEVPVREFGDQLLQARVDPDSDHAWITGAFGTLFQSLDGGRGWEMIHPEVDVAWNDVALAPDGTLWVVGEFGRVRRTMDGGENWEDVNVGTDISLMSIEFADEKNAVIVGLSGTIIKTSDGGQNWQPVAVDHQTHLFNVIWTGAEFVAVGNAGLIGRAGRAGRDWEFSRLAENNFSWYTGSATGEPGTLYLSGANLSVLENGEWRRFQEQGE